MKIRKVLITLFLVLGTCGSMNLIPREKGAIDSMEIKLELARQKGKVPIFLELFKRSPSIGRIFQHATVLENFDLEELSWFFDRNIPGSGFGNLATAVALAPSVQKAKRFLHREEKDPMVLVEDGWLRGTRKRPRKYRHFDLFLGIPYASKPTRFEPLKPMIPWSGVLNAQQEQYVCIQYLPDLQDIIGSEDCIYVNVATPSIKKKNLPVVVWVHGGLFKFGFGNMYYYGPDYIMQEDVVLVMFNYRLGALGFMCTEDDHIPGNLGMKDIVFFLKWLQRNIRSFGGDPDNVSLFGISSGSAAIQYLTLSPQGNGLFHKIMTNSGSIEAFWAHTKDPLSNMYRLAKNLDIKITDIEGIVNALKKVDAKVMIRAAEKLFRDEYPDEEYLAFVPCAEKPGPDAFMTEYPLVILESGNYTRVPTMLGFMDSEGLFWMTTKRSYSYYRDAISYIIPRDLVENLKTAEQKREVIESVDSFYFNKDINGKDAEIMYFYSDTKILYKLHTYAQKLVKRDPNIPVYYYEFGYDGNIGQTRVFGNVSLRGVAHADDCAYFFRLIFGDPDEGDNQTDMVIKRQIRLLYNFAKYGDPTPNRTKLLPVKWNPISSLNNMEYLEITKDIVMKKRPYEDRFNFWEYMYRKYGS